MNRHLLLCARTYAELRRRQLQHRNLSSAPEWRFALFGAGFADVESVPSLSRAACTSWDRLDAIGTVGLGRHRVATAFRKPASLTTSPAAEERVKQRITAGLTRRFPVCLTGDVADPFCELFTAEKRPPV
jgi:hypothetical protein